MPYWEPIRFPHSKYARGHSFLITTSSVQPRLGTDLRFAVGWGVCNTPTRRAIAHCTCPQTHTLAVVFGVLCHPHAPLHQVYDTKDEMMEGAMRLAQEISANSALAVQGTKHVMNFAEENSLEAGPVVLLCCDGWE